MSGNGQALGTVLVSAQSHLGGVAEHAHCQAQELARRGFRVVVLCRPDHLTRADALYERRPALWRSGAPGWRGRIGLAAALVINHWLLAWHVLRLRPRLVLLDCASEYLAPLWAWPHLLLRRCGRVYVANLLDPVRLRLFGPDWFHSWSVRLMYAMLDGGLVHGAVPAAAAVPPRLDLRIAPHGIWEPSANPTPRLDVRRRHGIPGDAALVLAFGHVADRKNLDLVIAALRGLPQVHLLVAGAAIAGSQRQVADYRRLAAAAGVASRVHFDDRFVPDDEIAAHFEAADIVALTYTRGFVSQSGVLQHAAAFHRPVLVSCGPGPLRRTMEEFDLGELVEPDSAPAIADALERMTTTPVDRSAAFAAYAATASWAANVDQLLALVAAASARPA